MLTIREELFDQFRSWAEVQDLLVWPWEQVRDESSGALLLCYGGELLLREPATGRAAQRRLLHKAGFRRDGGHWRWIAPTPDPADSPVDPRRPFPERVRTILSRVKQTERMRQEVGAMALRVLRDIYRCQPEELSLLVPVEVDEWDDGEDDEDDWGPVTDCATLEEDARRTDQAQPDAPRTAGGLRAARPAGRRAGR